MDRTDGYGSATLFDDAPHLASIAGVYAVAILGLVFAGLTSADVLLLLWIEGLIDTAWVALLMWLHRRSTRKRGHFMIQDTVVGDDGKSVKVSRTGKNLGRFVGYSLFLHAVYGVFFAAMITMVVQARLGDRPWGLANPGFRVALDSVLLIRLVELLLDAVRVSGRSMGWMVFRCAEVAVRMLLTAVFVIFGFAAVMFTPWPTVLWVVLIAAKALFDLVFHLSKDLGESAEPPGWLAPLLRLLPRDKRLAVVSALSVWGRRLAAEMEPGEEVLSTGEFRLLMEDELPYLHPPEDL